MMKKQLWMSVIFVLLLLALIPACAQAATVIATGECGADGGNLTYTMYSDGVLTISGTGEMKDYSGSSNNHSLAQWWYQTEFYDNWGVAVTKVVLEEGVTTVGANAFEDMNSLKQVVIPSTLKTIKKGAFWYSEKFTRLDVPDLNTWFNVEQTESITNTTNKIALYVNGAELTDLVIPAEITEIRGYAFCKVGGLRSVIFHDGVTAIGKGAFSGCSMLESLDIPDSVTSVGDSAFASCTVLESVNFPQYLESMGEDAFYGCTALRSLKIPVRLTELPYGAFWGCTSLTSVEFPVTMRRIGGAAFYNCTGLTQIDIPDNVVSVGSNAFYGCTNLRSIRLPSGLTYITQGMLEYCKSLETVEIPSGVTGTGAWAFKGCSSLKSIVLNEGMKGIETGVFEECTSLQSVSLPSTLERIYEEAFQYCESLTYIEIPENVISLGYHAFYYSGLKEVKFLGPAPSIDYAFSMCEDVTMYYSANSSSWNAETMKDYGAFGVVWVSYDGTDEDFPDMHGMCGNYATWNLSADGILTIGGTGAMKDYLPYYESQYAPWQTLSDKVVSVVIGEGITSVGDYAFMDCKKIRSVTFPKTLKVIGDYAFIRCSALESIEFPDGLEILSSYAFQDCESLKSVVFPKNASVGTAVFSNCTAMTSLTIPYGVTKIPAGSFSDCVNLTQVVIPDTVTSIGDAFEGCIRLTSINVPYGVESVSFENCSSLRKLVLPETITEVSDESFANVTMSELRFSGECPKFGTYTDPFTGSKITAYYPSDYESWDKLFVEGRDNQFGGEVTWVPYVLGKVKINLFRCDVVWNTETYSYDGTAKKPKVEVTFHDIVLKEGTDYSVSYSDNVNAGTCEVTVTGIGNYTGTVHNSFVIKPVEPTISYAVTSVEKEVGDANFTNPLTLKGDGVVTYSSNNSSVASVNSSTGVVSINKAGSAVITATLAAGRNYRGGSASYTLKVNGTIQINPITLSGLTYSFGNNSNAFGYSSGYRIPRDRYTPFFSDTETEYMYYIMGEWGGSCYGLSATSSMFNVSGSGLDLSMFGKSKVSDLKVSTNSSSLGMNVTKMIEMAHVSQMTSTVQNCYRYNKDLNELCETVISESKKGRPVIIGVSGPQGGHAIVGYSIEKVNAKTSRLYVYDCNFPKTTRYITLYTDSYGNYTGWYYPLNNKWDWGSAYRDCDIDYTPYSAYQSVWEGRKGGSANRNMLSVNSDDFDIVSFEGDVLASMENGEFYSNSSSIYEYELYDMDLNGVSLISLPADVYEIVNYDSGVLNAGMLNRYQSANVSTSADSVMFAVVDADECNMVYVDAALGDSYSVTLNSELSSAEGFEKLEFSGVGTGMAVQLGMDAGTLYMSESNGVSMKVNGQLVGSMGESTLTDISAYEMELEYAACCYDGTAKEPEVTLSYEGYVLKRDTDYTVVYVNNTEIGTATVAVYGVGVYDGTLFGTFEIVEGDSDACAGGHYWNSGEFIPEETGSFDGEMLYTCSICGATRSEEVRGYQYKLIESAFEYVTVSLTNNADYRIAGKYCLVAYDASGNIIGLGIRNVNLDQGYTSRMTVDNMSSNEPAKVKAFVLDANTYAPLNEAWTCDL